MLASLLAQANQAGQDSGQHTVLVKQEAQEVELETGQPKTGVGQVAEQNGQSSSSLLTTSPEYSSNHITDSEPESTMECFKNTKYKAKFPPHFYIFFFFRRISRLSFGVSQS